MQYRQPSKRKSFVNLARLRNYVTVSLAWLVVVVAWDFTTRVDDLVAYTQISEAPFILAASLNSEESNYETMHERYGCGGYGCFAVQRVFDRQSLHGRETNQ